MALNWVDSEGTHSITLSNNSLNLEASNTFYKLFFKADSVSSTTRLGHLLLNSNYNFTTNNSEWAYFSYGGYELTFGYQFGPKLFSCTSNKAIFFPNSQLEIDFSPSGYIYYRFGSFHIKSGSFEYSGTNSLSQNSSSTKIQFSATSVSSLKDTTLGYHSDAFITLPLSS